MKKLLLIAVLAISVFASCKKDEEGTLDSAKIQGRWDLVKEYVLTKENGVKLGESTETDTIGQSYFVISITDITLHEKIEVTQSGATVAKDSIVAKGRFTFLPGNNLNIKFNNGDSLIYNVNWVNDKKFIVKTNTKETINNVKYDYYNERTYNYHKN